MPPRTWIPTALLALVAAPLPAAFPPPVRVAPVSFHPRFVDHVAAFDEVLATAFHESASGSRVQTYWASPDRGRTWGAPAVGPELDLGSSWAAAGAGVLDGVLVTAAGVQHRRSPDQGRTWGPATTLDVSGRTTLVASAGPDVAVVWETPTGSGTEEIRLAVSHDGGRTWLPSQVVVSIFEIDDLDLMPPLWLTTDQLVVPWMYWRDLIHGPLGWLQYRVSRDAGTTLGPQRDAPASGAYEYPPLLAARGTSELVLVYNTGSDVRLARSLDLGSTWGSLAPVAPGWARDLAVAGDGETWLLSHDAGVVRLQRSTDVSTWLPATLPDDVPACSSFDRVHAHGGGEAVLATSLYNGAGVALRRTADEGATWDAPTGPAFYPAAASARVVALTGGRLVALWGGSALDPLPPVWSAVSADGGFTWSPPTRVNDLPRVPQEDERSATGIEALALDAGGLIVLWAAKVGSCNDLRSSRSSDGETWEPSVALVAGSRRFHLAEDGAGRLAVVWSTAPGIGSATSADGGRSWSPPRSLSPDHTAPDGIARAADGSLHFASLARLPSPSVESDLVHWSSSDGGASWTTAALRREYFSRHPQLVASGSRLSLGVVDSGGRLLVLDSTDGGQTWPRRASTFPWNTRLYGGDQGGDVYGALPGGSELTVLPPLGPEAVIPAIPMSDYPALVVPLPGAPALLFADWEGSRPTGLYYTAGAGPAGFGLYRDDSIRALAPRPDLAPLFPLAGYPGVAGFSGMTDPDAGVIRDASRPLVLYGLGDRHPGRLFLTRRVSGELELSW